MEKKVFNELSAFLNCHSLKDSIRNIDEIILSYFVGVLELVIQEDEGLDLNEVMDMMIAYLPGFDLIAREKVIEWMFGLARQLISAEGEKKEDVFSEQTISSVEVKSSFNNSPADDIAFKNGDRKFPSYEYSEESKCDNDSNYPAPMDKSVSLDSSINIHYKTTDVVVSQPVTPSPASISLLSSSPTDKLCQFRSKRKGRQLSCSSQESTDEKVDQLAAEEETCLLTLLEMFPGACTMEARHCLKLSAGDMDRAAQLIMDRQETGQAITDKKAPKNYKMKKAMEYKLDDDSIKSCVLKKYSFVDTEEDKKTFRPQPPKMEAKKLVRYRDGQVVSMKGEKFSEVAKKETDDVKATYVHLKPARKYRFH